jgi:type IV secretory pathway VirB10-like protein
MTDPTLPPATVTDKRPAPRGVLPRRLQMWLMMALALGMLAIIAFTGQSRPPARTTPPATEPQTPSADRLRDYQERLRALDARTAQARLAESQASGPSARPVVEEPASGRETPDPIKEERRRREYDSLFATNVVISRRPESARLVSDRRSERVGVGSPAGRGLNDEVPAPPSLDAVADAVVRASTRFAGPAGTHQAAGDTTLSADSPSAPGVNPTKAAKPPSEGAAHRILEGTVIDTVLINRVDGAAAAPVNCLVTGPVYSHDGQVLLIPSGSRILGETKPVQSFGENRLAVAFDRLLLPNGRAYELDHFIGLNEIGDAGLRDHVDQHYRSTFGASAAVGLLTGLAQSLTSWGTTRTGSTVVIAGSAGDATAQATAQTMNRFLNRLPTVTIREGHRVKVYLTGDLELPAYQSGSPRQVAGSDARVR